MSGEPAPVNTNLAAPAINTIENQSISIQADIPAQQAIQSNSVVSGNAELANLPPATLGDLSEADKAALVYMREEEKLANDVYLTLYDIWGLATFQNIASSEQAHTDSIKYLLDRYGIANLASAEVGIFTNPDLQSLYNELIARCSLSLAEAIKAGGAIEEIGILDLQEQLAQTDNADIQQVFNNLLRGSTGHLQSFVNQSQTQTGEVYQPQYMSQEAFQAILSSATGGGYGHGGQSGAGRNTNSQGGGGGGYRGGRS